MSSKNQKSVSASNQETLVNASQPEVAETPLGQPPVITSRRMSARYTNLRKLKILPLFGLVVLVIVIVLVIILLVSGVTSKLKTVTYNNGGGSSFQLKFYRQYSTQVVPSTVNYKELVSKNSVKSDYPLVVGIASATTWSVSNLEAYIGCTTTGSYRVMQVTNNPTGNSVNVCAMPYDNYPNDFYNAVLQSGTNYYDISLTQNISLLQISKNSPATKAALLSGLTPYNNDIKTILASVKPL